MAQLYTTHTHQPLVLGTEIGRGGEAAIYQLANDPRVVTKIYHPTKRSPAEKLRRMLANPPEDPMRVQGHVSIAWMSDLVQDERGTIVGYVMPKISGAIPLHKLYNPADRRKRYVGITWKHLHRTASNLAHVVAAVHAKGYVIGDLNESNILVRPNALVTVVDTDSFQVANSQGTTFRCPVGKPEYTAPEIQGVQFSSVNRTRDHDNFALGVLIFLLLMEGSHPFRGTGNPPELPGRIQRGLFPYGVDGRTFLPPPPLNVPFQALHPEVRQRFHLCFIEGHRSPCRPTAAEWAVTLRTAEAVLARCSRNQDHFYTETQRHCTWCERTRLLQGRDPFPEHAPKQPRSAITLDHPLFKIDVQFNPLIGRIIVSLVKILTRLVV